MPTPQIKIEIGEGAAQFEGRINALAHNLHDMPRAAAWTMLVLEKYLDKEWGKGEEVEDSTLVRWPDRPGPLENTGTLKASLTKADAQGAIREITPYGFKFGTSIFYARFLERGTKRIKTPKPVIPHLRSLRAVVGAAMRKFMLRETEMRARHVAAQAMLTDTARLGQTMDAVAAQFPPLPPLVP